jgi:hypothetical protein
MGGTDDVDNIVTLTAKEHFICHWILARLYPENVKIQYAFTCMSMNQPRRKLTSFEYSVLSEAHAERMRKWNPMKCPDVRAKVTATKRYKYGGEWNPNWKLSDEGRKALSDKMKANNPNKGGATNHTAFPVSVTLDDGTVKQYDYMKAICDDFDISYATVKIAFRNMIVSPKMRRMGIVHIEKYLK